MQSRMWAQRLTSDDKRLVNTDAPRSQFQCFPTIYEMSTFLLKARDHTSYHGGAVGFETSSSRGVFLARLTLLAVRIGTTTGTLTRGW